LVSRLRFPRKEGTSSASKPLSFLQLVVSSGISCEKAILNIFSGGSITLNTSNPFDAPLIDPGLLVDDYDVFAMRVAIKKAVKFVSAEAWKGFVIRPLENLAQALTSDEALEAYIRETVISSAHPVGSAAMSPKEAKWGVVGPDLLLKGATGIRVIDASVMVSKQITSMSLNTPDKFCIAVCAQWTHSGPNLCSS
jgi:choline dehydrogenase-like flavoprotein